MKRTLHFLPVAFASILFFSCKSSENKIKSTMDDFAKTKYKGFEKGEIVKVDTTFGEIKKHEAIDSLLSKEADLLDMKDLTLEDQAVNLKKTDTVGAQIDKLINSEKKIEPVKYVVKYQMTVNHEALRISAVMNHKLQILQVDTIIAL
jgi:hypothetical protein